MDKDVEQIQDIINKHAKASHVADAWLLAVRSCREQGMIDKRTQDAITVSAAILLRQIMMEEDPTASEACEKEMEGVQMNMQDHAAAARDCEEAEAMLIESGMLQPIKVRH